jgi:hypothetical protein
MKNLKYLSLVSAISLLSACSIAPSFSDMSQAYQSETEKYSNNNLLLNVMRASKDMPLSFLDIPSVLGSGSIGTSFGIGSSWFSDGFFGAAGGAAGAAINSTANASMNTNRGFNFTQSSLDNAEFTKTFISPLSMQNVAYFSSGETPKHLLFNLLIGSISFELNGKTTQMINDPYSANYKDFTEAMNLLVELGLTTEPVQKLNFIGPSFDEKTLLKSGGFTNYIASSTKSAMLVTKKENGKAIYQYATPEMNVRFCFNPSINKDGVIKRFGSSMLCNGMFGDGSGTGAQKIDSDKTDAPKGDILQSFALQVRSPRDVFTYLGKITDYQLSKNNETLITARSYRGRLTGIKGEDKLLPIWIVNPNSSNNKIATVSYDGTSYFVPQKDNGFSSTTLNLLAQLVSISKVAGSIPPSPAVLVK